MARLDILEEGNRRGRAVTLFSQRSRGPSTRSRPPILATARPTKWASPGGNRVPRRPRMTVPQSERPPSGTQLTLPRDGPSDSLLIAGHGLDEVNDPPPELGVLDPHESLVELDAFRTR